MLRCPVRHSRVHRWPAAMCGPGLLLLTACAPFALAESGLGSPGVRWREVWAGADLSETSRLVYSGMTVAPMGHIHEDGLRMRVTGGGGTYDYEIRREDGGTSEFTATLVYGEILAGYLKRFDPLTVKVFLGAAYIDHATPAADDYTIVTGADWGLKGALELWLNIGNDAWASLDAAYTTAHETASLRFRSGYRVTPQLSLGVEGGFNIDGQSICKMRLDVDAGCPEKADPDHKSIFDYGRTGLFARYEWDGGELSASAGAIGRFYDAGSANDIEPYVTVNWIKQF